jgi:nucleolin
VKKAPVKKDSSSDSDSSSEKKPAPKKAVAAPAKKAPAKKESSSDSDSSSEEKPAPKKAVAAPAKKAPAKKESSSDSDSSSEDEKPAPKKAVAAPAKKAPAKKDSSSGSDSSSEEEKPAPKKAAAPAKKAAKKESSSDEESEEEEAKPVAKKAEVVAATPSNPADADKLEVFIKSLSFDVDENALQEIFGKYGTMTKCKLVMSNGRSKGIAFVEYDNHESAQKAVDAENGNTHFGRQIAVEFSGNKPQPDGPTSGAPGETNCIFCGNIGFYTTEETIRGFFGQAGNVSTVRIALGEDGRARGFCHVEFETPADAVEAMKLNGQEIDGRACRLDLS